MQPHPTATWNWLNSANSLNELEEDWFPRASSEEHSPAKPLISVLWNLGQRTSWTMLWTEFTFRELCCFKALSFIAICYRSNRLNTVVVPGLPSNCLPVPTSLQLGTKETEVTQLSVYKTFMGCPIAPSVCLWLFVFTSLGCKLLRQGLFFNSNFF